MQVKIPDLPYSPGELEAAVRSRSKESGELKPGTEARIVWADRETKKPTPVSLVYLHGFSASHGEGAPVHEDTARRYGLNLYLARLSGHGLTDPALFDELTAEDLLESAAFAFAVGQRIGRKVILMGTSTGASLSLYLASAVDKTELHGLILYSPLVDFYGIKSWLLTNRWGRTLLSLVPGKRYEIRSTVGDPEEKTIWYTRYRMASVLALGELIERIMTPRTFSGITAPTFVGYYYQNRDHHDDVVSVPAIHRMYEQISTPVGQKIIENFPGAGSHVICSPLLSKTVNSVKQKTFEFSEKILGLNPL